MPRGKKKAVPPQGALTQAQRAYLTANAGLPDTRLAGDTGLTVEQVIAFRESEGLKRRSTFDQGLHRPAEGVVAMTAEAAFAGDDLAKMGRITQDMIDRAKAGDNLRMAEQLIELRQKQQRDGRLEFRAKNADRFHFLD